MKLTRIKMTNFRQHKNVDVEISGPDADILVIKGTMGAGKTNFLNAVTWAIYADAGDAAAREIQLLSHSVISSMAMQDYEKVIVEIGLELDDKSTAFIVRSQDFQKTSENNASSYGSSELTVSVLRNAADGYEVEPNPERWIDKNLPRRFRPYFLFDGEKLERFFQESDSPKIRSAIQEVARIDVLDRLQIGLSTAATDALQKASRLTGTDGDRLSDELGRVANELDSEREKIRQLSEQLSAASDQEVALDAELVTFGALEANIKQKRQLDKTLEENRALLETYKTELEKRLRKVAPGVFVAKALQELDAAIQDAKSRKVLPPPVSIDYLKSLLSDGNCVCGTSLSSGTTSHSHLYEVIDNYEQVSEVNSILYDLAIPNSNSLARLQPEFDLVDEKTKQIVTLMERNLLDEEELKALAIQLEGVDDEYQLELARKRNAARHRVDEASTKKKSAEAREDQLERRFNEVKNEIDKIESTNADVEKARKKARFAQELALQAKHLYKKLNDQVRTAVASSLDSQFKDLTWKEGYFDKVDIDENFRVSVTNNRGFEVLYDLSAGERLCLAFAFSLTLSKEAGLNFPIIVDTPMGRLAPEVQQNLAQVICDATLGRDGRPNHQILLLMTETEYNAKVEEVLSQRKPKIMQISFDEAKAETTVQ
jgi:DNA sulfur modification protein DndD